MESTGQSVADIESSNSRGLPDKFGNTSLHRAAANWYAGNFFSELKEFPELASARNIHGETPIFLAALRGSKKFFSKVTSELPADAIDITMLRRNDGETILHYALTAEYFGSSIRSGALQCCRTSAVKPLFYGFLELAWACILIVLVLAFPVVLTLAWPVILAIFGFLKCRATMRYLKYKHMRANEVMEKLLGKIEKWQDFSEINSGMNPYKYQVEWTSDTKPGIKLLQLQGDETLTALLQEKEIPSAFETNSIQKSQQIPGAIESPIMIAVKMGIEELVNKILHKFPEAIEDRDLECKNIIFLAVQHRQFIAYKLFKMDECWQERVEVDAEGNSILHLAAKYPNNQELVMSDAAPALQMLQEITWFNYFKKVLPTYFSNLRNHKGQTAREVFTETHQQLAIRRAKWLSKASQSCSVVATLIISVVFATISTVPGGLMQDQGPPVYRGKLAFNVFSVASLFAMCFSSISLIMFLGILTSPYQEFDAGNDLPKKLIYGLASLFISITALFLSFFCGVLFVLDSKMKYIAYPTFILTSCVALAGFPLYSKNVMPMITDILTGVHLMKLEKLEKGLRSRKLLHPSS